MFPFCCCEQKGEHEPKQNAARNKYSVALLVQDVCSGLPVKRSAVLRHDPAIRPSFTARVVGVHGGTTLLRPRSAKPFPSPPLRLCVSAVKFSPQRRRGAEGKTSGPFWKSFPGGLAAAHQGGAQFCIAGQYHLAAQRRADTASRPRGCKRLFPDAGACSKSARV